ncbi:hypothetical protein E4T56_gene2678 [Termitomyces sp. T112]|nr:hypothetical protein E4T56_gene2678 [Termitomyces sp. T112]
MEPAPTASAPVSAALVILWQRIPCPALPDMYNGACSENETAFSNALHSEIEEPQCPPSDIQTLTLEPLPSSLTPLKVHWHSSTWDKLNAFLQENLDSSCIHPSKSPMAFLGFIIKKKDGSLQLVQDYQVLNAMTVKKCYPLPLISKLINNLWGAQYFTKLDIWWSYNNMHIQKGDEWKAAFQTNWGLFKPLVMFFGLTNSPTTFQTMMNNIFQDLIAEGIVCVYLDNILIYTKMLEEHHQITCLVLETAEMDPVKVAGMAEWLEPKNKKEVQMFLGFANFYQRFIQDFSHHAHPLFDCMGKDVLWSWEPPEQMAFDTLKHAVTSRPVLLFLDDNSPFQVKADSSDFATGAMLPQQSLEDEKWHPVAFYSKSLNVVEWNYKIHDKEMLVIIWSFKK